jgi:E3 ubiquitin-protein ligase DOA10
MHCFVCHEETTERCACACKAYVHGACLLKTIEARQNTQCTICAQPIGNVEQQAVRVPSRWVIAFALALVSTIMTSSLAALLLMALAVDDRNHASFCDLLICCTSSVFLAMFASHFLQKLLEDHDLTVTHDVYRFI